MSTAPVLRPPPPDELGALVEALLVRTGGADVAEICRLVDEQAAGHEWPERLVAACESVGLRVRWTRATTEEAVSMSRPDLPVVTAVEDSRVGLRWVTLEGGWARKVQVQVFPDAHPPRRMSAMEVALRVLEADPATARLWGLVEPSHPAGPVLARKADGSTPTPLRRLTSLLQAERSDLVAIVLYAVAIGLLNLATPLAMQVLINWLAFGALQQPIIALSLVLMACLALAAGLRGLQRLAVEIVQRRIFVRMVADLTTRLTRVRVKAFDDQYGPELVNRFFDVLTVQKAVSTLLLDGMGAALQALVGLVLLAIYHPILMAYDVGILATLTVILFVLGRGASKTAIKESKAKYAVAFWMQELARHPMVFKLGDGERLALGRADQLTRQYLEARDSHWRIYFRQVLASWGAQAVASVALLAIAGWLVLDGELSVGQLVAAEFIVTAALAGFAKFAHKLDTYYDLLAGIDKLGQLVDLPQESPVGLAPPSQTGPASVQLQGVTAGYPGSGRKIGPIDLTVEAGARAAVIGRPGVGKSTICDLLLGVRRPSSGRVYRDDMDVADLRPSAVFRDAVLARGVDIVHGTISENIALGRPSASVLEVRRALQRVGLRQVVESLPDDLQTVLGPTGAPLSSSQALRLMVARALVTKPRLLVIDGLLDGIPEDERDTLLAPLMSADAPWTLIILTEIPEVANRLPAVHVIGPECHHVVG